MKTFNSNSPREYQGHSLADHRGGLRTFVPLAQPNQRQQRQPRVTMLLDNRRSYAS